LLDKAAKLARLLDRLRRLDGTLGDLQGAERALADENRRLREEVERLRARLARLDERALDESIVARAFRVVGAAGDYVEFGAFDGGSLIRAWRAAQRIAGEFASGTWDHSLAPGERERHLAAWREVRFIAFDSFAGMPEPRGVDKVYEVFKAGSYACGEEVFWQRVTAAGVPRERVLTIKGTFDVTATPATAKRINLSKIAIVNIDCDLYESARTALDFVTPYLVDGTIVIFDEWFQFNGNPTLGEQRAFTEWRQSHPEWLTTEFHKEGAFANSFILNKPLSSAE